MKEDEVIEKLRGIVNPYLKEKDAIGLDSHLTYDLALDSIDMVDVMLEIETTFSISIKDKELNGFQTVRNIVDFILQKVNGNG